MLYSVKIMDIREQNLSFKQSKIFPRVKSIMRMYVA